MTGLLALALAVALLGLAGAARRERAAAVALARTRHEIRGPLCAALLGLEALATGEHAARAAAVGHELRRAALALEELAGGGRRPGARSTAAAAGPVDVGALVAGAGESWRALAAAHGARLELDAPHGLLGARGAAATRPGLREPGRERRRARRRRGRGPGAGARRCRPSRGHRRRPRVARARPRPGRGRPPAGRPRGHGLGVRRGGGRRYGGRLARRPSHRAARGLGARAARRGCGRPRPGGSPVSRRRRAAAPARGRRSCSARSPAIGRRAPRGGRARAARAAGPRSSSPADPWRAAAGSTPLDLAVRAHLARWVLPGAPSPAADALVGRRARRRRAPGGLVTADGLALAPGRVGAGDRVPGARGRPVRRRGRPAGRGRARRARGRARHPRRRRRRRARRGRARAAGRRGARGLLRVGVGDAGRGSEASRALVAATLRVGVRQAGLPGRRAVVRAGDPAARARARRPPPRRRRARGRGPGSAPVIAQLRGFAAAWRSSRTGSGPGSTTAPRGCRMSKPPKTNFMALIAGEVAPARPEPAEEVTMSPPELEPVVTLKPDGAPRNGPVSRSAHTNSRLNIEPEVYDVLRSIALRDHWSPRASIWYCGSAARRRSGS